MPDRRLQMDFQPPFMAGLSLRKADKSHWAGTVQKAVVPQERPVCSICGFVAKKRSLVHADEVWEFPGHPRVILADVRPLCVDCHEAKDYAELLRRVGLGKASASRSLRVIAHYCDVNGCSTSEFDADFKDALRRMQDLDRQYHWNLNKDLQVEYGRWDRPADKPRITRDQTRFLRELFQDREEPIFLGDRPLANFGAAVRHIQSLSVSERKACFSQMADEAGYDFDPEEPILESDEGINFS